MRSIKLQFFLFYGSFAAVQPYLALYLKQRGLSESELGYAVGISGLALMLSPAVVALLADTKARSSQLIFVCHAIALLALGAFLGSRSFWALTLSYLAMQMALSAMMPLGDAIAFGYRRSQIERGQAGAPYSSFRIWGTVGFLLVLLLLFFPLRHWGNLYLALGCGGLCYAGGALNARFLPVGFGAQVRKERKGLPTTEAARALFGAGSLGFSVALFLLMCSSAGYHTMYPLYLADTLGLPTYWIGLVTAFGVVVEVALLRVLPRLQARWGLRTLMLAGAGIAALRFGLMYAFPSLAVAIGTQIFHGPMICAMMVLPLIYIDELADASNRNSVQGVYTMVVVGGSRLVGTALSGHVAEYDQRLVYLFLSVVAVIAWAILARWFRPGRRMGET